jgi:cell shape-determining protein MreC
MLVKKYSIPVLFSIVGIALIIVSFTEEQPFAFIFASFIIFLTSILLFLSVSGKVSNKITNIIGTVSFLLAGTTLYFAVGTVENCKSSEFLQTNEGFVNKEFKGCSNGSKGLQGKIQNLYRELGGIDLLHRK